LILAKEGKNDEAVLAFEKAKSLDPELAQSADVQIGLCQLSKKDYKKARDRFRAAVQRDPSTDLADFSRQYQDLIDKRIEIQKPLRLTVASFGRFDSNPVLKPTEDSLAPAIPNSTSWVWTNNLRFDFLPTFEGPFLFNAQYAVESNLHEKFSTSHDALSHGLYMAPGYNFGRSALNLSLRYNQALVRDPGYNDYVQTVSAGPLYRFMVAENQIAELFAGYASADYRQPPQSVEEDRDSDRFSAYASWIWLFKNDAFFNIRYTYSNDDTAGANWDNQGHDVALALTLPLVDKISLQLGGEVLIQQYENTHSFPLFVVKRDDTLLTGSAGLVYNPIKDVNVLLQYSYTQADSNIAIYKYDRSIYSLGLEWKY